MTCDHIPVTTFGGDFCAKCNEPIMEDEMSKEFYLELIKLLSRLESWAWSTKQPMPDWVEEQIDDVVKRLSDEVLK